MTARPYFYQILIIIKLFINLRQRNLNLVCIDLAFTHGSNEMDLISLNKYVVLSPSNLQSAYNSVILLFDCGLPLPFIENYHIWHTFTGPQACSIKKGSPIIYRCVANISPIQILGLLWCERIKFRFVYNWWLNHFERYF